MAGKPLNRLELRRQREAAEPLDPMEDETEEVVEDVEEEEVVERRPKKKAKAPAKAKTKSSRSSSKPAARMHIVWVVLNDAFKPVATFEYSQKEAAEARAAELTAKGRGTHFVSKTKEAMPEDAPGSAPPSREPPPRRPSRGARSPNRSSLTRRTWKRKRKTTRSRWMTRATTRKSKLSPRRPRHAHRGVGSTRASDPWDRRGRPSEKQRPTPASGGLTLTKLGKDPRTS